MTHDPQLAKLGLFDARVPRYTSYPTAPQFGTTVGSGRFADWIGAIPGGAEISLYVHVPFCRRLCWFCACRTQGTSSDEPVVAYVKTLLAEIALLLSDRDNGDIDGQAMVRLAGEVLSKIDERIAGLQVIRGYVAPVAVGDMSVLQEEDCNFVYEFMTALAAEKAKRRA